MLDRANLRLWRTVVIAAGLALFVAFLAANRNDGEFGDERNDTLGYQQHYSCLVRGGSMSECDALISTNATEVLYPVAVGAAARLLGPNFYAFKFGAALLISFAILLSCALLSKVPTLTLAALLLDFRFWEYVANSLRNGMAVAVFVSIFALFALRKKAMPFWAKLIAGAAHSGALVLALVPKKRLGTLTALVLLGTCVVAGMSIDSWLPLLTGGIVSSEKLAYYAFLVKGESTTFALPAHYVLVMLAMAYCYRKSDDIVFVQMCNVLLVLLAFAALLSALNLAYRAISLMLPFVAVGVTYPLEQVRSRLACNGGVSEVEREHASYVAGAAFIVMYATVLAAFVFGFIRNFEFVQIHLA